MIPKKFPYNLKYFDQIVRNKTVPMISTVVEPPSRIENPHRTHGKYGAWKFIRPKKFIRMNGLRRPHTYTNIMVNALPKKIVLTKNAMI